MKTKMIGSKRSGRRVGVLSLVIGIAAAGTMAWAAPTPLALSSVTAPASYTSMVSLTGNVTLGPNILASYTELAYDTATGYDFFLQVKPIAYPDGYINKVTLYSLGAYSISTGYDASAIAGFGGTPSAGGTPTSADLDGTTVEFNYSGNFADGLTSDWLAIYTSASSYDDLGYLGLSDGISDFGTALEPSGAAVPEAATWLFGFAIAAVIGVGALRKFLPAHFLPFSGGFAA